MEQHKFIKSVEFTFFLLNILINNITYNTYEMHPYQSFEKNNIEYVLCYKVNKNTWACVQKDQNDTTDTFDTMVEPINVQNCIKLEPTYIFDGELIEEPIYFIYWDNLLQVVDDENMLRQINEYNWTTGTFFCDKGCIKWNIADRIWQVNGVNHKMHIMTPRGQWFS